MQAVQDCDVLIAISNGNAGRAQHGGAIGICHAELMTGLSRAPGKVRLISLGNVKIKKSAEGERNQRFQEYVDKQSLFRGGNVSTELELSDRVKEAVRDALIALAQIGVREASKGRFHSGEALDWSRLGFEARQAEMTKVLRASMAARAGAVEEGDYLFVKFLEVDVLCVPTSIPAALSDSAAREMVGQPFLNDYKYATALTKRGGKRGGPVHIIACHKSATEAQATKLLGFSDATVVSGPFGIFVADNINKVQFAFIANCRDESNTRHGVQRFFEWLSQTAEDRLVARRAQSRARIVSAIAQEATV
jgi:hypothetical protein